MKLGYACINLSLPSTSSKTFRLASFSKERFLSTAKANLKSLMEILCWNQDHGIDFFRIGSGLIPFADHPICKIPWQKIFIHDIAAIGSFIKQNKMRISMHPDHFTILNSPRSEVVEKSIKALLYHNDILDLLGLDSTNKMQIHLGGGYDDKEKSKERFVKNYKKLPEKVKVRLVLENDDRIFSLSDCLDVWRQTGIPVLLDIFHHRLLNNGESLQEAILFASKTWQKKDGVLLTDFSSQAPDKKNGAHADYVDPVEFNNFLSASKAVEKDVMLEAKKKDLAVLKLFSSGLV